MTPRCSFVFRFDAGPTAGAGHFMRQLALAQEAVRAGSACLLLPPGAGALAAYAGDGIDCARLPDLSTHDEVRWMLDRFGTQALYVIDSYRLPLEFYRVLCRAALVVAFEDGERNLPATLTIKPRPRVQTAASPGVLEGCAYVPVRREFASTPKRPLRPGEKRHLVVCFGASDPTDATQVILGALPPESAADIRVSVVCGPLAGGNIERLGLEELRAGGWQIEAVHAPDMAALLATADAAVVAAGGIVWELATLSVPTLAYAVVDNQRRNAQTLLATGAIAGGRALRDDLGAVPGELRAFLSDHKRRVELGHALGAKVDGRGAQRVVRAALSLHQARIHARTDALERRSA